MHRLKGNAANATPLERVADDQPISSSFTPRLTVTTSVVDAGPFKVLKRFRAHAAQIGAAQMHERIALGRVELGIDLQAALVDGKLVDEIRFACDAQTVGVDHDVADRPAADRVKDGEEIGMQGRFAPGQLHQIRLALARHQGVEHAFDRCERQVLATGGR